MDSWIDRWEIDSQQPTSPIGLLFLKLPPRVLPLRSVQSQLFQLLSGQFKVSQGLLGKFPLILSRKVATYRGGLHMRSLISIDFPAPEMEPESVHVVSAVSVPYSSNVAIYDAQATFTNRSLLRYSVLCFTSIDQCNWHGIETMAE